MSVWESKAVKSKVGNGFIFDGNKIGWWAIFLTDVGSY